MRKALISQVIVLIGLTAAWFLAAGATSAAAAACGGGVALVNALLLDWRFRRGIKPQHADAGRHLRSFVASAVERFVLVVVLLAIGIGPLQLDPLALLAGFIAGQAALVFGLRGGIQ